MAGNEYDIHPKQIALWQCASAVSANAAAILTDHPTILDIATKSGNMAQLQILKSSLRQKFKTKAWEYLSAHCMDLDETIQKLVEIEDGEELSKLVYSEKLHGRAMKHDELLNRNLQTRGGCAIYAELNAKLSQDQQAAHRRYTDILQEKEMLAAEIASLEEELMSNN